MNEDAEMGVDGSTAAEATTKEAEDPFARFWIGLSGELAVSDTSEGTQIDQQQRVEMPRFSCIRLGELSGPCLLSQER